MKNRFTASLILLTVLLFLYGCEAPRNEKTLQRDLALKVTEYIGKDFSLPNYSYKYQILCNKSVEGLGSSRNPSSNDETVPESVKSGITKYSKNCNPEITALSSFFELLDTHLTQYQDELVLIIQFPWRSGKQEQIKDLERQLNKIKQENNKRIKKVFIFGTHGESPKTMQIFSSLASVTNSQGTDEKVVSSDLRKIEMEIRQILSDKTKQTPTPSSSTNTEKTANTNTNNCTIWTLFIPAEGK